MRGDFCPSEPAALQRAIGELRVSFKRRGEATVLDGLRQEGCLKARFPHRAPSGWLDLTTLNVSGGIAGGDRLASVFVLGEGAHATIASQAAERFYRALPDGMPSDVRTRIEIAVGADAEWLPQETILFDRCALNRRLEVDLAADAGFLGVEMLVFGRTAMGERMQGAWLRDLIRVRRDGRLLLHDAIRLDGEIDATLRRPAIGAGARAVATLVHVAPHAESMLDTVRDTLATSLIESAASAWDGMLVVRFLAAESAALRQTLIAVLAVLRAPRPLPRVWLC
jgi:urease accessory protein